jgi:phenylacetaldehyde dehydrogenase
MHVTPGTDQLSFLCPAARAFVTKVHRLLIDGAWIGPVTGGSLAVIDPSTGLELTSIASGGAADVDLAVRAARRALEDGPWATLRPVDRERLLLKLADLLELHADELAEIETIDSGKLLPFNRFGDLKIAIDSLRYMAGWATKIEGATLTPSFAYVPDVRFTSYTLREPVGVVGAIIPWNFPLVMAIWKIAPALAMGCTIILKPAEETSLTALRLGELILEAGIPAGVVNIVTGSGPAAGAALVEHPGVDKIAFTGSTEVGREIQRKAAASVKRVSLELGGKSPVIVLADTDVGRAVQGAAQAIFFNHGQVCTAGSRLFVEEPIFADVMNGLTAVAKGMRLGAGFDPQAQMGPLVSAKQLARVQTYVDSGVKEGAELLAGGAQWPGPGFFIHPAVFANTRADMKIVREEIFGPVVAATPFKDIATAVALANDTAYGLGASIWTNNLTLAHRLIPKLKTGNVWINSHNLLDPAVPFGGVKASGYGRELGRAAVDLYTETKSVTIAI